MRKFILALLVCSLCLGYTAQAARADGAVFPGELSAGYVGVRYHRVNVTLQGSVAVTRVEQEFYNPYDFPLSAQYLFPIPPHAELTRFRVWLDGEEQSPARQDAGTTNTALQNLVSQHHDPSLLQYLDWETLAFEVKLAAGSARRMTLEYEQALVPAGGLYRYHYVLSTERYAVAPLEEATITVDVKVPGGVSSLYSPSHLVETRWLAADHAQVSWQAENVQPTQDFDLFFAPADQGFGAGLLTAERNGQGHFLFLFSPQALLQAEDSLPKDIVFVIDCSGSMAGEKIEQVRSALHYFIDRLAPRDRFSIVSFNEGQKPFSETLKTPEGDGLAAAHRFVDSLRDGGSTNIEAALQESLAILERSEIRQGSSPIVIFLTDGQPTAGIIDDNEIVRLVTAANQDLQARLHVFGVGYDVNTHLLDGLSAENLGSVTYVQPGESLENVLTSFYNGIAHPVLTNLQVEFEGMQASQLYPRVLPDLFADSAVLLSGLYQANGHAVVVRVRGQANGEQKEFVYRFDLAQTAGHDFVPRLWATRRVGDLLDQVRVQGETPALVEEVRALGLDYGVVTPYTTFVVAAQSSGAASASNMDLYYDQRSLNQNSGQVTIQARVQNQAYQNATQADLARGANVLNNGQSSMAQVTDATTAMQNIDLSIFQHTRPAEGEWVTYEWVQRNVKVDRQVAFGSAEYFALAEDPLARAALQSGVNVWFVHEGQIIQVYGDVPDPAVVAQHLPAPREDLPWWQAVIQAVVRFVGNVIHSVVQFLTGEQARSTAVPASSPAVRPLQTMFKGVELYSWQAQGGEWNFALLPGTNRQKYVDEIVAAPLTLAGVEEAFSRLAVGEQVFWLNRAVDAYGATQGFPLPPQDVVDEVAHLADTYTIHLHIP